MLKQRVRRSHIAKAESGTRSASRSEHRLAVRQASSATEDLLLLQRTLGNAAIARLLENRTNNRLQRHSEDEEAKGVRADEDGTPVEEADDTIQRRVDPSLVQRVKDTSAVKTRFDDVLANDGKTEAVNFLKKKYSLNTKPYALSVAALPRASTHASTGGGWGPQTFSPIRVRVNEPYLDKQAQSEDGFNKLIHTLGHEYQHVKQRSKKGWQTTGDASAKGEREFLAYSFEILEAGSKKGMAPLAPAEMASTIRKAFKYYAEMAPALQTKHQKKHEKLTTIQVLNGW